MIKTKQILDKITQHNLVKEIFENAMEFQRDLYDPAQSKEIDPKPKRKLTDLEYFLSSCGFTISHLLILLDQIIKIPSYLLQYQSNRITRKYGVTRLDDITYHYENYIIRCKSIEDRLLQICNSIFHLGFELSDVNYKMISNNSHVKNTNVLETLKKIHLLCDKYAQQRNKIIHQHSILHPDLRKIELMLTASRTQNELSGFAKIRYRQLIKEFILHQVPGMESFLVDLLTTVQDYFDKIYLIYSKSFKRLTTL